ncbi:MAG: OmpA family protein, partial [Desulfobacteraceae bacterium]|nr:OmpA family protein [Desulfobacteraceae bacterium]
SFLLAFASSVLATEYSNTILNSNLHTTADLYDRVRDYKSRIEIINEQIKGIMDEMEWLYLNMERIKDSERKVPYSFFASIKEKKYNIRRLQKERDRYYQLVESFLSEINRRVLNEEKYSIQNRTIQKEVIEESTIKESQESVVKETGSELKQDDAKFEKLASETKRLESILDRYADLIKEETQSPKIKQRQKVVSKVKIQRATDKTFIDKKQLYNEIQQAGLIDWIEMIDSGTCLRLKTTLPILFPVGSAEIAKEYKSFFSRFANLLKAYEVQIMVEGYADIDPIHNKKYPSNFELGAIRAANVVHELVKNGLKPSIFKINSPGKYRFTANGESTQKALERRAEVIVVFVS